MARLFWLTVMAAFVAALLAGASWAAALSAVGTLLGAPPPEMGHQSTTLLWQGAPQLAGHPRVLRIYVSPFGRVVATDPADLAERVKALHPY